jgi:hypothetical protein
MKCPYCPEGEIKIKEVYRQEEKILVEYCSSCSYEDEIHLHNTLRIKK